MIQYTYFMHIHSSVAQLSKPTNCWTCRACWQARSLSSFFRVASRGIHHPTINNTWATWVVDLKEGA